MQSPDVRNSLGFGRGEVQDVFYRRFRPDQFEKLVGQESAVALLTACCRRDSFHHAYLFQGPSGSGKTTCARILAAAVNCERRAAGGTKPCGECPACRAIKMGCCADVVEMDGASDGGKDEVLQLIQSGNFAPSSVKRKVFVIDECHELSRAAMTSLLKPIEEPLPTVMFILCTSEYAKIPKTIVSRCFRVPFRVVPDETVAFYLDKLAKHLKVECEPDVAKQVASVSEGNMRLALNFFQSMTTTVEPPLTADKAQAFLGLTGRDILYDMADAIAYRKTGLALEVLERLMCTGPDAGQVLMDFSEVFRNAMLIAANVKAHLSAGETRRSEKLADDMGLKRLANVSQVFSGAYQALVLNKNPKWVMESLVVKLSEEA